MTFSPPASKVVPEKESRRRVLLLAQQHGMEELILKIFARYDEYMKACKTQEERDAVGTMGVLEIHNTMFADKGSIEVNGKWVK